MKTNKFNTPTEKELELRNKKIPEGLWIKCKSCEKNIYYKDLGKFKECPNCSYGMRLGAKERIEIICDDFEQINSDITAPSRFDDENYQKKLKKAKEITGLNESVLTGFGKIDGHQTGIAVMDSRFIMASLGTATGELLAQLFDEATKKQLPVIVFTASGGARMQEGINSLMQMAKVSEAISQHAKAGLLYISAITDPTTGGVTASFAMQGDIIISEPKSLIGFAGRRVIENTIQQKPPKDFQQAETLLKNGFLDAIVKRSNLKNELGKILAIHEGGVEDA